MARIETGLTKQQIISELSRSPHGNLKEYIPLVMKAAAQEPEFLAHLIAWDAKKGQVRDAKVALPIISLAYPLLDAELVENAMAHVAALHPREFLRAYRFALEVRPLGRMRQLRRLVERYLRYQEQSRKKWDGIGILHRKTLHELYALTHTKPGKRQQQVLFLEEKPSGSVFDVVAHLKDMSPTEAAAAIVQYKIPFLILHGALGERVKDTDLAMALIGRMSATELVTNTKLLESLGVKSNPALRAAYESGLQKVAKSQANLLKTTRAAEAVGDEQLKQKLRGAQEKQLASGGVDGNWLVLADKSGSMENAIDVAKHVAAVLAKMVKGKVWLVFFDTSPMTIDVTGLALDQIQAATRHIRANGGTSIGCGLQRMMDENVEIDGIAIVSDGDENRPPEFASVYQRYAERFGKDVPVYLYHCLPPNADELRRRYGAMYNPERLGERMTAAGLDMQTFELGASIDYYSLPNMVATMRCSRYGLCDEIMAMPLLTLDDVFENRMEEEYVARIS